MSRLRIGIVAVTMLAAAASVWADAITIDGQRYDDVLITRSSVFYYVQIPDEGRTINIPVDQVNPNSVTISDDPYYRDELKAEYERNRAMKDTGKPVIQNPSFQVEDSGPSQADVDALLRGGGGGGNAGGAGGAGISRNQFEQMLSNFGAQFRDGPQRNGQPSRVARMPDGTTLTLVGPPNRLTGLNVKGQGTPQQYAMFTNQMKMTVARLSPGAVAQVDSFVADAEKDGRATLNLPNGQARLTYSENGGTVKFEYDLSFAN